MEPDTPFIGQIIMFAGNFAPRRWAFCHGQLLAISQYDVLFSVIGTTYGGDGRTTFALPDLRGRVPIHAGQGPGLSNRTVGQRAGQERVSLDHDQLAAHTHGADMQGTFSPKLKAAAAEPNAASPEGANLAEPETPMYHSGGGTQTVEMNPHAMEISGTAAVTIDSTGGGQAHDNMAPSLGIEFIICVMGEYPYQT